MKTYNAKTGPFNKRPYYELKEVERICLGELRAVNLLPEKPTPIRIDRFLEKKFGAGIIKYDDTPSGVLGFTVFGSKNVREIVISRTLDEDKSIQAERRVRTTLAHEGGHGLLHAHLFTPGTDSLFGDFTDPNSPKVLCRDEVQKGQCGYSGNWWEFQANMAMGALLLPRPLVDLALEPFFVPCGLLGMMCLDDVRRDEAVRVVAEMFDVNAVVAQYRIGEMYPVNKDGQLLL